ncbi:MAG: heavy metal translocating P-type ATPase, partial [Lentisphaeria bacterium]|nr:heavy metal translocating P-type ATPase [Lentisphaeria bacterium]
VDGVVLEGAGSVDESMLTGESLLIAKTPGSKLAAGTLNGETLLVMQADAVGKDTLLAHIVELVRNARTARLPIRKLADKVSAVFVPAVLAVALVSLIYWGVFAGNWSMALGNFIAVLLAACPCSLGLAAPLAVMVGTGVGARHGILIKDPSVLENLRKVDTLMLDKTGTLTENKPLVKSIILNDNVKPEEFYPVLLALEHCSNHPLAQAVCSIEQAGKYNWQDLTVDYFTSIPGQGVQGCVDDVLFYLGSAEFIRQNNIDDNSFLQKKSVAPDISGSGTLILANREKVLGMVLISDKLRPEALQVITALKLNNIDLVILSGDSEGAVKSVAYQLGIEEFYSRLSPQGKLEKIKNRQAFGRCVAMLGDGVNDAAALAAADVSVAMGSGTDAALENSGVTLLAGNISKMAQLLQLSQAVNNTIKLNLMLAFASNIILIPMAAGAFYSLTRWQFSPIAGSMAMSGSCLLVVFNSLKLWKLKLN